MSRDSGPIPQEHLPNHVGRILSELRARMGTAGNTAQLRAVRREFSRKLAQADAGFMFQFASRILQEGSIDCRFVAYELIAHHPPARKSLNVVRLDQLGRGTDSWVAVDMFAIFLAGPAWQQKQISDAVIRRWSGSPDRWWRRAALVATVPLNSKTHGGTGDARRTLAVCRSLLSDRDDMVVKAMSWALRELAKRDPKAVKAFLRKQGDLLAPRVLREVNNKLDTGLKNPRRAKQA